MPETTGPVTESSSPSSSTPPPGTQPSPVTRRGRKPLKQERAWQTRRAILDAAAHEFNENGFAGLTLQDVAERANLTKGALYFHFTNKEALAVEIIQAYLDYWQPMIESVEAAGRPPMATLIEVLNRTAEAFRTNITVQAAARVQIERTLIHADVPTPYVGWISAISRLTKAAKEAGELRQDLDPEAAANVVVSSFFGMQHISNVLHDRADQQVRYREMLDVVLRGISANPDAGGASIELPDAN